jgi:hypothetical protein
MHYRSLLGAFGLAVMTMSTAGAQMVDAKYPNLKGQWNRVVFSGVRGQPSFDQTKSWGPGQQAPLTPEYRPSSKRVSRIRSMAVSATMPTDPAVPPPACHS